jgi:hypothetical protein
VLMYNKVKTSDITNMHVEVINHWCIAFATPKYYGNIMVRESRSMVHRCLLEKLKVDTFIHSILEGKRKLL